MDSTELGRTGLPKRAVRGKPFPSGADHPRYKRKCRDQYPSAGKPLWQVFREYTEESAHLLVEIMRNRRASLDLRARCAAMILQRGWGDAPKALVTAAIDDNSRAGELSEADIVALFKRQLPALDAIEVLPEKEGPPSEGDEDGTPSGTG